MTTVNERPAAQVGKTTVTLPSDTEIRVTRLFRYPRKLVWKATTKPEHIRNWWGPRGYTITSCESDFRVGGKWRFVLRRPDGAEDPFCGEYREIVPEERLAQTFVYDVPVIRDHPCVETATYEDHDGHTLLTVTITHALKEARDGHLQSGMEPGMTESHDRLDELLATLA